MNLAIAVERYLDHKEQQGFAFEGGRGCLTAFLRRAGDAELAQVNTRQVLTYLDESDALGVQWRTKYQILYRFFNYWSDRGVIPELAMPPSKPKVRQTFVHYIYTRSQLHELSKATRRYEPRLGVIDRQTMRTLILLLYGTGAFVGEILSLKCCDIDLGSGLILIRGRGPTRFREIPIGNDLIEIVRKYMAWRSRKKYEGAHLLVTKSDQLIRVATAFKNFDRIRRIAGIQRPAGAAYQPRMIDLKFTFAVHRITSWIRNGADMNRMLPALAAYMGQAGLGSTERYILLTPERFRKELNKLSPTRSRHRWRNDNELMKFLNSL
jgi:integrase